MIIRAMMKRLVADSWKKLFLEDMIAVLFNGSEVALSQGSNLYPTPQTVCKCTGLDGSLSIFSRNLRM